MGTPASRRPSSDLQTSPRPDRPVPRGWTPSPSVLTSYQRPCPPLLSLWEPPRHPSSFLPLHAVLSPLTPPSAPLSTSQTRSRNLCPRLFLLWMSPCLYLSSCHSFVSLIRLCCAWVLGPYLCVPLGQLSKLPNPYGPLCFVLLSPVNGKIQLAWRKEMLQQAEFQLKWRGGREKNGE